MRNSLPILFGVLFSITLSYCGNSEGSGDPASGSSGGASSGGTGSSGSSYAAVAKAGAFTFTGTSDDMRNAMVGTYNVAIYDAPTTGELGPGTFVVAYAAATLTLTLKNSAGTTLVSRSADDSACGDGICINVEDATPVDPTDIYKVPTHTGRRIGIYNYTEAGNDASAEKYFTANFFASGVIAGSSTGYYFRNDVTHYGTAAPAVFAALAGTYTGTTQQLVCPIGTAGPVTVVFASSGSVDLNGRATAGTSCTNQTLVTSWNGLDDLIVPAASGGGSRLLVDMRRTGGSNPTGGIFIDLTALTAPLTISKFYTNYSSAVGNTTSLNLIK